MNRVYEIKPIGISKRNDSIITDQGYTYNQTGFTYNQVGVQYGGISSFYQVFGINNVQVYLVHPSIVSAVDSGTTSQHGTIILYAGMGMGLLLALTYPQQGTIIF